jgi:molecular chaperone GrpE
MTKPPRQQPADAQTPPAAEGRDAELERQAQEAKDQYLRTLAEMDNLRKRLQREKEEFSKYAVEGVARELLPIVDSLDQALVAVDRQSDPQTVARGVHLIYRQLLGLLEKEGIKRIPTVGHRYDPHLHEAAEQVPAPNGEADGTIVEEVHVGYTMHGKVIRPALVKVARAAPADGSGTPDTA